MNLTLYPTTNYTKILQQQYIKRWNNLILSLRTLPLSDPKVMAFVYMVRRLGQSVDLPSCEDVLCATCASDLLAEFGGTEANLLKNYEQAYNAIISRINGRALRLPPQTGTAVA